MKGGNHMSIVFLLCSLLLERWGGLVVADVSSIVADVATIGLNAEGSTGTAAEVVKTVELLAKSK